MAEYNPPYPDGFPWPIFDSIQFSASTEDYATITFLNANYLKLSGGTMTGTIFSRIISMSDILINTVSSASTNSTTGALQISGGAYFGNDSIINANLTMSASNSHIYLSGNASGIDLTGTNSNISILGAGGHLIVSNTEGANSSGSQGALKIQGGIYTNANNFFNSTTQMNSNLTINSSIQITNNNAPSSGAGLEMGFSTGSNTANIYSYNRSTSTYLKLNLNDLITVDKANNLLTTRGNFDIGQSLYINDGLSNSALLTVNASNNSTYWQSPSVGGYGVLTLNKYGMYFNPSTGSPFGTCHANCLLDFGSKAAPCSINLYGGTYSISANNNATQICTGGTNGITFYNGASYDVGSYIADFSTGGSLTTASGVRIKGSNTTGYSGSSLELEYSGGQANIFAYNRSTLLYRPLSINNTLFFTGLGQVGVGQTVSGTWLMDVSYNTQSIGSYGYLTSGGSVGTSGSSGNVNFSARFNGRIAVGSEIDVFSDIRVKSDIRDITIEEAELFVENIVPKYYVFKKDTHNDKTFGYLAQDIAKLGQKNNSNIQLLVCATEEKGMIEQIDEDGFVSPKDILLTVNYQKTVALLHKYILKQKNIIEFLESENKENNERINELVDSLSSLDRSLSSLDRSINHIYSILHIKNKKFFEE